MKIFYPSDVAASNASTNEEFICLRFESRNLVLPSPRTFEEAYALARSVFPSLTNQSFAFHTDALPISGGEWVEVPAVSWRALRPALSSLVIHLSKDHTAELQKDEEEVNLNVDGPITSESPSVVSPETSVRVGPPVGRARLAPSSSTSSLGRPPKATVTASKPPLFLGSPSPSISPASPVRPVKEEMGPPLTFISPFKRPSSTNPSFAASPSPMSVDAPKKRRRESNTEDDSPIRLSETPAIGRASQAARAASASSSTDEPVQICVYPPGGVASGKKHKVLQVKQHFTVAKIIKTACKAFTILDRFGEPKHGLQLYDPAQSDEDEQLDCQPEDTIHDVLWQGKNFVLVPFEERDGSVEVTYISD